MIVWKMVIMMIMLTNMMMTMMMVLVDGSVPFPDHVSLSFQHQLAHSHQDILLLLSGRLALGREGAAREENKLKQGEDKWSLHLHGWAATVRQTHLKIWDSTDLFNPCHSFYFIT